MRNVRATFVAIGLLLPALLAACSSGGGEDNEVATRDGDGTSTTAAEREESGEEELLAYVECLRGQGLDVPDPVVDQNGNFVLPFGPSQGGDISPSDLDEASDVCGEVPTDAVPGMEHEDETEMEDMLLEFAECMRDQGIDLPDPDISAGPGSGGPFGDGFDLDNLDAEEQAAYDTCRSILEGVGPGGAGS